MIQANLIAGILTVIPLLVVWLVLDFILSFLFAVGSPVEAGVMTFITDRMPEAAPILDNRLFQWLIAIVIALLLLHTVGAIASRMVGKKLIAGIEGLIARIPVVETVYSASKKLIGILQQKPDGAARVVLIEFPHPGMKAIGLVMRVFTDTVTGEELAAVYVPTTPNPTGGYFVMLKKSDCIVLDMSVDEALTYVISMGVIVPGAAKHPQSKAAEAGPPSRF